MSKILGDINGNGTISGTDLVILANHVAGISNIPLDRQTYADLNKSGTISGTDVVILANIVSGINSIDDYYTPEPEPEPEPENLITETISSDYHPKILYIYHKKYLESVEKLKDFRINQKYSIELYQIQDNDTFETLKIVIENKNSNHNLDYILLFGSIEEVPTKMRSGINENIYKTNLNQIVDKAASDISYGHIEDEYKITVGRLSPGDNLYSVSNNELSDEQKQINILNQVNKIIEYENIVDNIINNINLVDHNSDWLKKIIGIASNEGNGYGIDKLADNIYMRKELERYQEIGCHFTELYDGNMVSGTSQNVEYDKTGDPIDTHLIEEINQGSPLLLYAGHASENSLSTTSFSTSNVSSLNNQSKYFLGCVVGCSIGSHDEKYMSLAENLQIAEKKGSIAMFASSVLQSWKPPMHMQRQLNTTIINTDKVLTIGEIFKLSVSNPNFKNNFDFWYYHILGDPCTRFLLTIPELFPDKINHQNTSHNSTDNISQVSDQQTLIFEPEPEPENNFTSDSNIIIDNNNTLSNYSLTITLDTTNNLSENDKLQQCIDISKNIIDDLILIYKQDYHVKIGIDNSLKNSGTLGIAYPEINKININPDGLLVNSHLNNISFCSTIGIIIHEIFHIFGIGGSEYWNNNVSDNQYNGLKGVEKYKELLSINGYDPTEIKFLPLEDDFGNGTASSHIEEGLNSDFSSEVKKIDNVIYPSFPSELMTGFLGYLDENSNYVDNTDITIISLGLLEDLGFKLNYQSEYINNNVTYNITRSNSNKLPLKCGTCHSLNFINSL